MALEHGAGSCGGLTLGVLGCVDAGDPVLNTILALTPVLFGFWMLLLGGETWRVRVGLWLYDASWSRAYAGLLQNTLLRLRWLFGRPWGLRALAMCIRIAVIYTIFYLILTAEIRSLPETGMPWLLLAGLPVFAAVTYLLASRVRRRFRRALQSATAAHRLWLHVAEVLIYFGISVGLLVLAAMISVLTNAHTNYTIISYGAALVGVVISGGNRAAAGILASVILLALGVTALGHVMDIETGINRSTIEKAFAFSLLLPALNAVFDWPSWAASRWLMRRLRADADLPGFLRRGGALLGHLAIDGTIAIACLFGIAIGLINLTNAIVVPEVWTGSLVTAKSAPFSIRGSTMTVMLLSTLVPTALHLSFALFALAAIRPPYRNWFVGWIDDPRAGGEWGNRAIVSGYLTFWMVFAMVVLWGASVLALHGLDALWLRLGWGAGPYPFWSSIFDAAERFVVF